MSAEILTMPVRRPAYVNQHVHSFALWYRDNEPALTEYYDALTPHVDEPDDFLEFAMCQFDRARNGAMP